MASNTTTPPSGSDVAGSAIFKRFLSKAEGYLRQPTRLKQLLADAYRKASDKKEVGTLAHEAWMTLQTLFRLIKASVSGEYTGVPTTTVAAAVAVLIYFLSPIDLIPDIIPVLGLLDDMALVAWFSATVKSELDKFAEWEQARPTEVKAMAADHATNSTFAAADYSDDRAQPAPESAKHHGLENLPTAPAGADASATDAGLGSPSSSTPAPSHEAGPDAQPSGIREGLTATSSDSSRDGTEALPDNGGNNR